MGDAEWESAGSPTIGDTISFDVGDSDSMYADAFKGTEYLVTDEFSHDGTHVVSFVPVSGKEAYDVMAVADDGLSDDADASAFSDGSSPSDTGDLSMIPGIISPEGESTPGQDPVAEDGDPMSQSSPSMRLIVHLMMDHGMSLHEVGMGLMALEGERREAWVNPDVAVEVLDADDDLSVIGLADDEEEPAGHGETRDASQTGAIGRR